MVDTTWAALNARNSDLIFKALGGGAVFVAPTSVALPTGLTAGANAVLQTLPVGYKCIGWLDKTGARHGREITASNVNSWGAKQPTRIDITQDLLTTQVIAQETNIQTMALDLGCETTDLVPDETTGEIVFNQPETQDKVQMRMLVLARDVKNGDEAFFGRVYPLAEVTARTGQQWQDSDDAPIQYDLTFSAFYDSASETVCRHFWGGKAIKDRLAAMGFVLPESSSSSSS